MKFTYVYTYQPSYLTYFMSFVFMALLLVDCYANLLFVIPLLVCCALCYHQLVNLRNKLMVAINQDGICIWQKGNSYLLCPFESVTNIEVRNYKVKNVPYDYLYLEYSYGTVLTVAKSSSYAQQGQQLNLEVLSEKPASGNTLNLYIRFRDVKPLENALKNSRKEHRRL